MYVSDILKLTLRTGPSTENKILAVIESGQMLNIVKFGDEWSQAQLPDGKEGWVLTCYLTPDETNNIKLERLEAKHKNFGPDINSRQTLAGWMTSPENPMFTKATVNRLWRQIMGTELVGPLGGLTEDEMGDHPALTEKLIEIMKAVEYDPKQFLSAIFNVLTLFSGNLVFWLTTLDAYL